MPVPAGSEGTQRRHYLVAVAAGGLAGCSGVLLGDETRDSDGDGVVDEQDYAPRDADVQSKDDPTSGDGGTADTDGDGVIDSEDYAPGDPEVREKTDQTDPRRSTMRAC